MQMEVCNQITKDFKKHKKTPNERITKPYIEIRIQRLEELWKKFNAGHDRLLEEYSEEYDSTIYTEKEVYDVTSEIYMDYKEELMAAVELFSYKFRPIDSKEECCNSSKHVGVKLPKIVIPNFSGNYSEWITFKDLFESLVHNNDAFKDVEKLHYLKGYLTGEAELLLRQIPISNINYVKCWELLKQRYDNKRYICNTILKRLLSQKNATLESSTFLKELIDTSSDCLSALDNIGIDVSTWDAIIIHLLSLKLDLETRKQWELSAIGDVNSNKFPTFQEFKEFITRRYRALEFVETKKPAMINPNPRVLHVIHGTQCPCCSEPHKIVFCKKFSTFHVTTRRAFVQKKGLCFNCLGAKHSARFCQNPTKCRICKRSHHTLLHPKGSTQANTQIVASSKVRMTNASTGNKKKSEAKFSAIESKQVLLPTAMVKAKSKNGEYVLMRAVLDQGSQISFITEAATKCLGLKMEPINRNISGLGKENNLISKAIVVLNLQSLISPETKISVKAYVLETITASLPETKIDLNSLDTKHLRLADPNYHTPSKIDILLGAEVFGQVILDGIKKDSQETLVAQFTKLGWIISGIISFDRENRFSHDRNSNMVRQIQSFRYYKDYRGKFLKLNYLTDNT